MRGLAEWKPKARRVISRSWVLIASTLRDVRPGEHSDRVLERPRGPAVLRDQDAAAGEAVPTVIVFADAGFGFDRSTVSDPMPSSVGNRCGLATSPAVVGGSDTATRGSHDEPPWMKAPGEIGHAGHPARVGRRKRPSGQVRRTYRGRPQPWSAASITAMARPGGAAKWRTREPDIRSLRQGQLLAAYMSSWRAAVEAGAVAKGSTLTT
jgi:hypothetical protein